MCNSVYNYIYITKYTHTYVYIFGKLFPFQRSPHITHRLYIIIPIYTHTHTHTHGLSQWLSRTQSACGAGDAGRTGLIPGLGRSPGEGNGNLLQYSCLGNLTDRGAWQATVQGVKKSWTE